MGNMETLKFGLTEGPTLDTYSCFSLTYSSITDKKIAEKVTEKNSAFFAEDYLLFLMSPEETGSSFQMAGDQGSLTGPINLDLVKKVNAIMAELPEDVKQSIIDKINNLMVAFVDIS